MLDAEHEEVTRFLDEAIRHFGRSGSAPTRVLDFGCGSGTLVERLASLGYAAEGCDIEPYWDAASPNAHRMRLISRGPYRLPYDEGTFDVVVSTSVLEHAQNKAELFQEIHRVLAPHGV